jgi:hypothetical protein
VGKNNLLKAIDDLARDGITFDIKYSRGPFFLHGNQKEIEANKAKLGLPPDAHNLAVFKAQNPTNWQSKTFWFDNFLA